MTRTPFPCPACGLGAVALAGGSGRRIQHRMVPDLVLPPDLMIPTCSHCGERWIDDTVLDALQCASDKAFEQRKRDDGWTDSTVERPSEHARLGVEPQRVLSEIPSVSELEKSNLREMERRTQDDQAFLAELLKDLNQ